MGTKRLIVLDHNVSGIGGHFAELASVIIGGGIQLGFEPWLVSHQSLNMGELRGGHDSDQTARIFDELSLHQRILPLFTVAKMHRWSLATSGHSRLCRNSTGAPRAAGLKSYWQSLVDHLHKESPQWMMKQYSKTIVDLFDRLKPTSDDLVLFATCEDFNVLSAASAIRQLEATTSFNLHFLFHANLLDQRQGHWLHRGYCNREYILQMEEAKRMLAAHRCHFWATTRELADQLNQMTDQYCHERHSGRTTFWHSIDYPVRQEFLPSDNSSNLPKRLIMGGKVRSEKGAKEIRRLVKSIWQSQLVTGRWQLCLQASHKNSARLLPRQARNYLRSQGDITDRASPISFLESKLSAADYASLIRSADAGLFMYDSKRYYARCSGVLVEMLSSGVPVIVPSGCWLSRQIAGECAQWLALRDKGEVLYETSERQTLRWKSRWCEFSMDIADARAITIEAFLATQRSDDYVGFQIEQPSTCSPVQSNHCEVFDNGPVRCCFRVSPGGHCKLRIGLPFQQRDLELIRLVIRSAPEMNNSISPTSSIGLMAASTKEIPRLLEELDNSYEHYRDTAVAHSRSWRERHSGLAFVQRLTSVT